MIAIVDYGAGNLRSVFNAFEAIGQRAQVTSDPADLKHADAIVLPGVGAFNTGMENLEKAGFVDALNEEVKEKGKPYLGICLGMQFLADVGLEHRARRGLGWIKSTVRALEPNDTAFRVPHMGWNDVQIKQESPLFNNLEDRPIFYFLHSYDLAPDKSETHVVTATCWHGQVITAAVQKDNIFGVQFHPEKSQGSGLNLLRNFVKLI